MPALNKANTQEINSQLGGIIKASREPSLHGDLLPAWSYLRQVLEMSDSGTVFLKGGCGFANALEWVPQRQLHLAVVVPEVVGILRRS